jgi:hypothetical protein
MKQVQFLTFGFLFFSISIAGAVEAARSEHIGLFGLFAGLLVIGIALAFQLARMQRAFVLRSDISHWVDEASAVTGESPEVLVNRALSAYRAGLSNDRPG